MANVITDEQNFIDIANSIRAKNGSSETYSPGEMSAAIDAITVGSGGTDTSDATAIESEILADKTAYVSSGKVIGTMTNNGAVSQTLNAGESYTIPQGYHDGTGVIEANSLASQTEGDALAYDIADGKVAYVNGQKVTGLLGEVKTGETLNYIPDGGPTFKEGSAYGISLTAKMTQDTLLRRQSYFNIDANSSDFGDATPEDVVAGKTFTSTSGIKVAGTLSSSTGIDTSDATASATDIANGKTAYVNRDKITGTLNEISAGTFQLNTSTPREYASDTFVVSNTVNKDRILRDGVEILIPMNKSFFGNAAAEDVVSGKTFTSANGLNLTGTYTGLDTSDADATANDILSGKTAYVNGSKITGVIETVAQAIPSISVDQNGLITASAIQDTGYVEAGTKSATNQLSIQSAQTITPSTSNQVITSGKYLTGDQTIKGDINLVAENIKNGVSIFGVAGTLSAGIDTSDATAIPADILSGKTAYVNGSKVTGTIATVTQATPSISVNSSGLITASSNQEAGYVGAGTKSSTSQLTTQGAQTITPGTTNKTIASGTYLTGTQTIKGDSNLVAANIKSGVSIFGVTGSLTSGITPAYVVQNGTRTDGSSYIIVLPFQSNKICHIVIRSHITFGRDVDTYTTVDTSASEDEYWYFINNSNSTEVDVGLVYKPNAKSNKLYLRCYKNILANAEADVNFDDVPIYVYYLYE